MSFWGRQQSSGEEMNDDIEESATTDVTREPFLVPVPQRREPFLVPVPQREPFVITIPQLDPFRIPVRPNSPEDRRATKRHWMRVSPKQKLYRGTKPLGYAHHDYTKGDGRVVATAVMSKIMSFFNRNEDAPRGFFRETEREMHVPLTTIRNWYRKLKLDPEWAPWQTFRGDANRVFTIDEEENILNYITKEYFQKDLYFDDEEFRSVAFMWYFDKIDAMKTEEEHEAFIDRHQFHCSNGFIYDFKKMHRLSSRRARFSRRSPVNQIKRNQWIDGINKLIKEVGDENVVNCDETQWLLFARGLLTWRDKGAENVHLKIRGSEKEGITVLAAMTASLKKLPLLFIAKGKTNAVHGTQIGDVTPHWVDHTTSGWQTEECFIRYLRNLRAHMARPFHLICDLYAAHKTDRVKLEALQLGITLYFIPPGCTDDLQPLDRRMFGVLKSKARNFFRDAAYQQRIENLRLGKIDDVKRTKQEAAQDMVRAWSELSNQVMVSAWKIYQPGAGVYSDYRDDEDDEGPAKRYFEEEEEEAEGRFLEEEEDEEIYRYGYKANLKWVGDRLVWVLDQGLPPGSNLMYDPSDHSFFGYSEDGWVALEERKRYLEGLGFSVTDTDNFKLPSCFEE
jgi:hypothetical protein